MIPHTHAHLLQSGCCVFEYDKHLRSKRNLLRLHLQASVVLSTAGKYTLAMIDAAMEGRWASKGTYVFYLELVTDMLHLFVYLIFFVIVFANYGLPLHLVSSSPLGTRPCISVCCCPRCAHLNCKALAKLVDHRCS